MQGAHHSYAIRKGMSPWTFLDKRTCLVMPGDVRTFRSYLQSTYTAHPILAVIMLRNPKWCGRRSPGRVCSAVDPAPRRKVCFIGNHSLQAERRKHQKARRKHQKARRKHQKARRKHQQTAESTTKAQESTTKAPESMTDNRPVCWCFRSPVANVQPLPTSPRPLWIPVCT